MGLRALARGPEGRQAEGEEEKEDSKEQGPLKPAWTSFLPQALSSSPKSHLCQETDSLCIQRLSPVSSSRKPSQPDLLGSHTMNLYVCALPDPCELLVGRGSWLLQHGAWNGYMLNEMKA